MRHMALVALVLAACESGGRAIDAGPDVFVEGEELAEGLVPFSTAGTTPEGALEVNYLGASFNHGFCLPGYNFRLWKTNRFHDGASVMVIIPIDEHAAQPPVGTVPARATHLHSGTTVDGTFEIVSIDLPSPDTTQMHVAGRVRVDAPEWHLDFALDLDVERVVCF